MSGKCSKSRSHKVFHCSVKHHPSLFERMSVGSGEHVRLEWLADTHYRFTIALSSRHRGSRGNPKRHIWESPPKIGVSFDGLRVQCLNLLRRRCVGLCNTLLSSHIKRAGRTYGFHFMYKRVVQVFDNPLEFLYDLQQDWRHFDKELGDEAEMQ